MDESKKVELVWLLLNSTMDCINLAYRDEHGFTNELIRDIYDQLNESACKLADLNVMSFQQEV